MWLGTQGVGQNPGRHLLPGHRRLQGQTQGQRGLEVHPRQRAHQQQALQAAV